MTLEAPEHQKINGQVKVTWKMLRTISHHLMVHARVLEGCINFPFMYTIDHIFTGLPIKDMINADGDPTIPFKLATGTEPSVSYLCMLFCPCVVWKATANVDKKALNMHHQTQEGFRGILIGIPEHQKGYLVYIPSRGKIISSYDVVFGESFSSALAYTSQPYSEAMAMHLSVTYTPYATSLRDQTGDIIMFTQFEESNI